MEELRYKLDKFEGPLDLLLTLIKKNKVSSRDNRSVSGGYRGNRKIGA